MEATEHEHGLKCTGCDVQPGTCCRHCPAAIAAEEQAARPNARMRAALLEVLDLADRAGVQLSGATAMQYRGGQVTAHMHGQGAAPSDPMGHTDALRILLRVGAAGSFETSEVRTSGSTHVVHSTTTRTGVAVKVFAAPTPAQLEAATVEAVLQS